MPERKTLKKAEELKKKLLKEQIRTWDTLTAKDKKSILAYADHYRAFLQQAPTERRAVKFILEKAAGKGFVRIDSGKKHSGKLYLESRGKILALAVIGKKPLADGIRIVASHIDCPRLDLKTNPLYEDSGLAFLKTHYYGGIKKFHWVARPLAICGTVIRRDGSVVEISMGLDPAEPAFTITDLLPHLSRKQMEQKASEFMPAENLNILVGGFPYPEKEVEERIKLAVLDLLHTRYKITEEDFTTAEIQMVPAEPPRDLGFDRALIGGYGQDDRICAYASFTALLETATPEHTAIAIFYDKEEIGSEGNTSARSSVLELFLMDLMAETGMEPTTRNLHTVLFNGKALSADVAAGLDPTYPDVYEKRNSARLGHGINLKKYTGSGGKYSASDANAEYVAWVRKLFNDNGVAWQAGGMGKVDEGGGGTVAKYLANTGIDVVDCGPPVLGMHSPFEVSSKEDLWSCNKAFKVFFRS